MTGEDVVLANMNDYVEIARRAASHTRFPVARTAQARTVLDAGGDTDFQFIAVLRATFAAAAFAGLRENLAGAVAARAGGSHGEEPARMSHLALATTRWAGLSPAALSGSATVAFGTRVELGERDFFLRTTRRFFEIDFQIVPQIVTALRAAAGTTATGATERLLDKIVKDAAACAAKDVAEDFKRIMESAAGILGTAPAATRSERGMAKSVIGGALLLVAEDFVGFADFLEFLLGFLVSRILVGMVFERQLAIGLLDFLFRDRALDAKHLVIIALGHSGSSDSRVDVSGWPLLTTTRAGRTRRSASL